MPVMWSAVLLFAWSFGHRSTPYAPVAHFVGGREAQSEQSAKGSLRGISAVVVTVDGDVPTADKKAVRTQIELRWRQNHIRVLNEDEFPDVVRQNGGTVGVVSFSVAASKSLGDLGLKDQLAALSGYRFELAVSQLVYIARIDKTMFCKTWSQESVTLTGSLNASSLRFPVDELADRLLNDYLAVNGR